MNFKDSIKTLSENNLDPVLLSSGYFNIYLIGEHHYEMNEFLSKNKGLVESISSKIIEHAELTDAEILIESGNKEQYADLDIWNEFIDENEEFKYFVDEDMFIDESVINFLNKSDSIRIKRMDTRTEVMGIENDEVFLSNFCNSIINHFGFCCTIQENKKDDEEEIERIDENNKRVCSSIINQVETVIIRKLVIYLKKNKTRYTSNPIIKRCYENMFDKIINSFLRFKKHVYRFESHDADKPIIDTEFIEYIIYGLNAIVLDLNIIDQIFVSDKKDFIVYAGKSHTFNITQILMDCGFELSS
jgi:hypothetical protein